MRVLFGVPALLTGFAMTAFPVLWLDGRAAYLSLLWNHGRFFLLVAVTWTAIGYWTARRLAEVVLLRRSGAKLRMNA